jgi:N-acetylglutamate synthase-like GNAT family acetyltransferase
MQAESRSSFHVPLLLKLSGVALILGIVIDYLTLIVPPNFLNNEWVANLIDQFVGRGVVPLLGVALLFWGMWMDGSLDRGARKLLTPAVLLSVGLGLMFLLFTPLYFNSNRLISAASSQDINKQTEAAAQQLNRQLAMRQGQVMALIEDRGQVALLEADLKNEQINPADKAQLEELKKTLDRVKNDPKLLEAEVAKARTAGVKEIEERQGRIKAGVQQDLRRARMRITSISFVLAIGYLWVGATGFGMMKGDSSPAPKKSRSRKSSRSKRMGKGNA